jgi:hypothetical protein
MYRGISFRLSAMFFRCCTISYRRSSVDAVFQKSVGVRCVTLCTATSSCLYLDSCRPDNKEEAFQIFWVNFHSHYTGTRAPLLYTMHASWLREKHNYEAMNYFLLTILHYYSDVFIVSYQQLLAWVLFSEPRGMHSIQQWGSRPRIMAMKVYPEYLECFFFIIRAARV